MTDIDWNLKDLQTIMKDMLFDVHLFCMDHDIKYCVAYGSALGAKRHGGFIPWDDDVDIYMPYEDYCRFCEIFPLFAGDKYYLQKLSSVNGMCEIPKIRLNHTYYEEALYKTWDMHKGIFIDIFVLYDAPKSKIDCIFQYLAKTYITLKNLSNRRYKKNAFINLIMWMFRLTSPGFLLVPIYKVLIKYQGVKGDFYLDTDQCKLNKTFINKKVFFPSQMLNFDGITVCAPGKIEEYLTLCYGDYNKIPTEDEIKAKQHCSKWSSFEEIGYSSINNGKFRDECLI